MSKCVVMYEARRYGVSEPLRLSLLSLWSRMLGFWVCRRKHFIGDEYGSEDALEMQWWYEIAKVGPKLIKYSQKDTEQAQVLS